MPKKKRPNKGQVSISVRDVSQISGNVNIASVDITATSTTTRIEKTAPRLLGDASTDAPPPDVKRKKKRKGE